MCALEACFWTKAVYLASSQSSSVRSSVLIAASSGKSLGTVGDRLGDTGDRPACAAVPPVHVIFINIKVTTSHEHRRSIGHGCNTRRIWWPKACLSSARTLFYHSTFHSPTSACMLTKPTHRLVHAYGRRRRGRVLGWLFRQCIEIQIWAGLTRTPWGAGGGLDARSLPREAGAGLSCDGGNPGAAGGPAVKRRERQATRCIHPGMVHGLGD